MKQDFWLAINLIGGGAVWLLLSLLALSGQVTLTLMGALFLLAPLLIVPLGLGLVGPGGEAGLSRILYRGIRAILPAGAAAAMAAFFWPRGLGAGILAGIWLGVTLLVALLGLTRFLSRRTFSWSETGIDAGLGYLGIGGGWFLLSRLELNPLGFDHTIVLLTAIHFHYAGFAAPLIAAFTGRVLAEKSRFKSRLSLVALLGIVAGTPLVAAGITFSPFLEVAGAIVLATSLAVQVYLMALLTFSLADQRPAQLLLTLSGLSMILGLGLIYLYAVGEFSGYTFITIPQMVQFHGAANALGFALCGLLGLHLIRGISWRCTP